METTYIQLRSSKRDLGKVNTSNSYMQALMNLPSVKNTVTELRAFYDSIERSLLSLGTTPESYGAMLIPVMLGKLPAEV